VTVTNIKRTKRTLLRPEAGGKCPEKWLLPTSGAYPSLADIEEDVMIESLPEEPLTDYLLVDQ
jgi:hypothetical protein